MGDPGGLGLPWDADKARRYGFLGEFWATATRLYHTTTGFEFKSEDPNGLLLYTDDGGRNDWFELRMENRKLKLRFVLFYTPSQREMQGIITSEYKVIYVIE